MKPVVLFYSFSGSTRRVAGVLARRLGAPAAFLRALLEGEKLLP